MHLETFMFVQMIFQENANKTDLDENKIYSWLYVFKEAQKTLTDDDFFLSYLSFRAVEYIYL